MGTFVSVHSLVLLGLLQVDVQKHGILAIAMHGEAVSAVCARVAVFGQCLDVPTRLLTDFANALAVCRGW